MSIAEIRAAVLQENDLASEPVDVPEWPCKKLTIWQMPEKRRNEFDQWNKQQVEREDFSLFHARLVADTAGDESGALIFTHDDVPALAEKSSVVIRRISAVAYRVNRMGKEAEDAAAKNSGSDLGGSLPSTSQEN